MQLRSREILTSRRGKNVAIAAILLIIVAIVARFGMGEARMALLALDPNAKAVMDTVVRGEQAVQRAGVVPAGYLGGPMSPEVKASILQQARARLAAIYLDPIVETEMAAVSSTLDGAAASGPENALNPYPVVFQEGGARALDFPHLSISGDTARVTGEIETWLVMSQVRDGVAHPARARNVVVVTAVLVRQRDGGWKIIRRDWRFAPGQGP
jgi:ketosteroid isomerase-like protein